MKRQDPYGVIWCAIDPCEPCECDHAAVERLLLPGVGDAGRFVRAQGAAGGGAGRGDGGTVWLVVVHILLRGSARAVSLLPVCPQIVLDTGKRRDLVLGSHGTRAPPRR